MTTPEHIIANADYAAAKECTRSDAVHPDPTARSILIAGYMHAVALQRVAMEISDLNKTISLAVDKVIEAAADIEARHF